MVSSILEQTTQHGAIEGKHQTRAVKYYNLDAIISADYRVNSSKGTQFRIWATQLLKEYIIKGFGMDDERIKSGGSILTEQYCEEQLQRIREILQDAGKVIAETVRAHAESEVKKYRIVQDRLFESDVDRLLKHLEHTDRSNDSQE